MKTETTSKTAKVVKQDATLRLFIRRHARNDTHVKIVSTNLPIRIEPPKEKSNEVHIFP